jgi:serine/threonine protein kinase
VDPFPGANVGPYRLDRKVGEGAFGAVWSGTHRENGDRAAFKVLLPTAAASPEQVSRFHREADLLARVQSRNVARMIDFVVDPQLGVVLVMELIDGELLSDLLHASKLDVATTLDLGMQLLAGVRDLHAEGIVHRDLKPNNVMLCSGAPDGSRRVVIFDLGLGRLLRSADGPKSQSRSLTPSFVVLGTLACIAPEQVLDARHVTERADLYAIGVILHYALTGHYPFDSHDERTLARDKVTLEAPPFLLGATDEVVLGLRDIVAKAIRLRPADRYPTAAAMLADLDLVGEKLARAKSRSAPPPSAPKPSRSLGLWLAVVVVVAALASALAWR